MQYCTPCVSYRAIELFMFRPLTCFKNTLISALLLNVCGVRSKERNWHTLGRGGGREGGDVALE